MEKNIIDYLVDFYKGIKEKDAMEHLADFGDGVKSLPKGLYNFGDYLARVSGFRDWQEQHNSVMYDGVVLYIKHAQAWQDGKLLKEAAQQTDLYPLYLEVLKSNVQDKPAYYIGGLLTGYVVGAVLSNKWGGALLAGAKFSGLATDFVHEVMEELRNQLGATKEEFLELMESGTLQEKIEKELGGKVHYQDGALYIIDDNGKGYKLDNKLENSEWKEFDNDKDKLMTKDKSGNWSVNTDKSTSNNNLISADMKELFKQQLGTDMPSEEFMANLALTQEIFGISDEDVKEYATEPQITDEMVQDFTKVIEAQEKRQAAKENDKEEDNVQTMTNTRDA
jgi:hypothetical protein